MTAERLRMFEWDWHGRTQRAVVGERSLALAFHYRASDAPAVAQVVALANAALATRTAESELLASEEELREVDEFLARVYDAEQGPEPVEEVE